MFSKNKLFYLTIFLLGLISQGKIFAEDLTINQNTVWQSGVYTYDNVLISNGATLTFNGAVTLNAKNLTIDSTSAISADGKGYAVNEGAGHGGYLIDNHGVHVSGGGYGGEGGSGYYWGSVLGGITYGSALAPLELGSGGGSCYATGLGYGGGAIRLIVSDTLTINGKISANGVGTNVLSYAGGSGGSIYLTTNHLIGSGEINANGGNSAPWTNSFAGGGGGRVAVYYQISVFNGTASAQGGGATQVGVAKDGTVVFVDTANNVLTAGSSFRFQENDNPFNYNSIILDKSTVTTQGNVSITAGDFQLKNSTFSLGNSSTMTAATASITATQLTLNDASTFAINNPTFIIDSSISLKSSQLVQVPAITLNHSTITLSGERSFQTDVLTLINNSLLTSFPQKKIDLMTKTLTIDFTSAISADGKGYAVNEGPGHGSYLINDRGVHLSGGGYGGEGGSAYDWGSVPGGITYGSALAPFELGSGGGSRYGSGLGYGGGAIRLIVSDTLTINGKISANGIGTDVASYAGGSGGSIYLTTNHLIGSGAINANGGNSAPWTTSFAGGGGGRVAVYYQTSLFNGTASAEGGGATQVGVAKDGTVILQGSSLDTPLTAFTLLEKSFTVSILNETFTTQGASLSNVTVSGDLNGSLNFADFEIVKIVSGSFAGKGFSKGKWQATLEGLSYQGDWKGVSYFIPSENKIYLKGEIAGEIAGICEGFFTESTPGSGIYDNYQATWKINRLGTETISATLNLEGVLFYQPSHAFTSELYFYQANLEGNAIGSYTGPLSVVLTHLRLTSENEYKGQGLSIVSYNSILGQGEGWAYNYLEAPKMAGFQGLFNSPFLGKLSAHLDETKSPRILSGTIERLDLGQLPEPDLKVRVWGPQRVSPGQTVNYIIEYRNDGLVNSTETAVVFYLDPLMEFISGSNGLLESSTNEIAWNIGDLSAKSIRYLFVQAKSIWGLPEGTILNNYAFIESFKWHSEKIGTIRNGVNLPKNEYFINNNGIPEQWPDYKSWRSAASKYDSDWAPILNTESSPFPLADALHAALASPIFGDGNGNPIPTDYNGLKRTYNTRDYTIEYSGGNAVGDGALVLGKEIIAESPGKEFTKYKISPTLFNPDIMLPIYKEKGVKKVVIYQSDYDDMIKKNGSIFYDSQKGWTFQIGGRNMEHVGLIAKFLGASEVIHLFERNTGKHLERLWINMKAGTAGKYGPDRVFIKTADKEDPVSFFLQGNPKTGELFKTSDFANVEGISVEIRDRSLYKIPHEGWQTWILNCENIFTGKIDAKVTSELFGVATSQSIQARDPNEIIVSPEGNVQPGERLNYTINYENEGEGIAYGIYITDTLEEDLDDSTLELNNIGEYDSKTRTIKWFIGELGSKQKGSVSFSVKVKQDAQDKAEVINFATVYFPSVPEETRTNGVVNKVSLYIDNVAPVTTISVSPVANEAGWHNSDTKIALTGIDNEEGSGVKEIRYKLTGAVSDEQTITGNAAQISLSAEGKTIFTCYAVDGAGNIEPEKSLEINIDKTVPTITAQTSPGPNSYNWNNTDVTVTFTADDALSGIASVTEPAIVMTEGANQYIGAEALDKAGNKAASNIPLNIDKTPPTITAQSLPQPNELGWNNTEVTVSFSGQDSLSGIKSVTQPITVSKEGKGRVISGESVDFADNKTATTLSVSIDRTPPSITIASPVAGVEYILNAPILANWFVSDVLSGVALATGTVPDGEAINTSTVGTKIFKVVVMDNAGNKIEQPLSYYVRYGYNGVLPPINQDGSSIFKLGRVIPVKFQLKDGAGNFIFTAIARIYLSKVSNDVTGTEIEAESVGEANSGNLFRYSSADNQYIFNLGTSYLSQGTWRIRIELDDGSSKYVNLSLK